MPCWKDSYGTLWVGTFGGGLDAYDRETDTFTNLRNDPEDDNSLSANVVKVLFEDRDGVLWVGTFGSGLKPV